METYISNLAMDRLRVALGEAREDFGTEDAAGHYTKATVNVATLRELQSQVSAGRGTGLVRRRRAAGMAPKLPSGRIVAVAWRDAGSEALTLLIGRWVLASHDDALVRRAAVAVGDLMLQASMGAMRDRQQMVALAVRGGPNDGGVAIWRQLPTLAEVFGDALDGGVMSEEE